LDAADEFDVVLYRRIERREAAGVDAQRLARLELHRNKRAAAVNEHVAGAFEPLKDEPFAAKEAGAGASGELDVDVDLCGGAQERIALAQDRGVEQRHPDNLSRVGTRERDLGRRSRAAEERQEEALAGEQL